MKVDSWLGTVSRVHCYTFLSQVQCLFWSLLRYMSIGIANVFVLVFLWTQILYSIAKHLIGVVLFKHVEEPWILTRDDHLSDH
jgi:hypothetical protein